MAPSSSDPILLLRDIPQGKLVPDKDRPDYSRYVPTEGERAVMVSWLADEIRRAEKADESRCENILKNRKAYRARENEKDRIITLPLIKRDVNQQAANLVNSICGKDPICTVKPEEAGKIDILIEDPATGQPTQTQVTTVEEADALQMYGQHLLRKRVPFRRRVEAATLDMCRGGMPYFQIGYEANFRVVKHAELKQNIDPTTGLVIDVKVVQVRDKLPIDEPLRFEVIDGMNVLMPPGETDEQLSPWFAKRWEISPTELRRRFGDGRYDFCEEGKPDGERIDRIASGDGALDWQKRKEEASEQVGNDVSDRTSKIPLYEVWFYWPVKGDNGEIDVLSLCAQTWCDGGSFEFLNCYENFYAHGRRPFVPCLQAPDPFEWYSDSTAESLRPIQNLQTAMYHITVKNGTQAITKSYKALMNSPGSRSLKEQNKGGGIRPGAVIEVGSMNDIEPFQTGGTFGSLQGEMQMLDALGRQLSVTPEYQNIPNRTPTGTTQAIMGEAKAQGQQTLERMREALSSAIQMLMQTAQQFEPYGRRVPFKDPKTTAILERYVGMPVNLIEDQFSFEITATSDEDTKQALREAETINLKMLKDQNESVGEKIFNMLAATTPPFLEPIAKQLILREEAQMERLLRLSHKDSASYTFDSKEMDEWLEKKHAFLEQEAQKKAQAAAAAGAAGGPGGAAPSGPSQAPPPGPPPMPPEGGMMPMGMAPGAAPALPPDFQQLMAATGGQI
jgi:hypothetical protein